MLLILGFGLAGSANGPDCRGLRWGRIGDTGLPSRRRDRILRWHSLRTESSLWLFVRKAFSFYGERQAIYPFFF